MKYKTIMLSLAGYSRLARAKKAFSDRIGSELSFNEFVSETLCNNIEFLEIDNRLRSYINGFVDKVILLEGVRGVLLFGSIPKGSHHENSDIDLLIVVKSGSNGMFGMIDEIASSMHKEGIALMSANLPSLINPIVIGENSLTEFRPFYFDIADYGVVLYEKGHVLTDMIYAFKKRKHSRQVVDNMEVLTWK